MMLTHAKRTSIVALAFILPLLVGIAINAYAASSQSNGSNAVAAFGLFAASAIAAALVSAAMVMTGRKSLAWRLGMTVFVWLLLAVEVWCTLLWLLRGID